MNGFGSGFLQTDKLQKRVDGRPLCMHSLHGNKEIFREVR